MFLYKKIVKKKKKETTRGDITDLLDESPDKDKGIFDM